MGRAYIAGCVLFGCVLLAGCAAAPPPLSTAQAVDLLRTGRPLLSCREDCVAAWRQTQPEAARLDAAGRWPELAAMVLRIGYQDDLTLYYLARAAEGIGYPGAAASYYRQSTYLSGTVIACRALSRVCGGLELPKAALLREAAINRELTRAHPRRGRPPSSSPAAPDAAPDAAEAQPPGDTGAPSAAVLVPTPLAPAPAAPASPPPAQAPKPSSGSDFIEPPPAAH